MVRPRLFRVSAILFIVAAACLSDRRGGGPLDPNYAVSDGAHSGGTPGFYFLPPMVPLPVTSGTFDADITTINPVVVFCDVTDGPDVACGGATPALRTFTTTSTPAIVLDGEKYKVDWDTKEGDFLEGRTYRVHVRGGTGPNQRELGFADILLTTEPGKVKNLANNETIALNDGRTLPIHFRIEVGVVAPPGDAVSFALTGLPASLVAGAPASVTVTARDQNGQVATGYRGTVTFSSSDPAAVLPADYPFTDADAGVHTFSGLSFQTAGAITLRVADVGNAELVGEAALTVEPGAATVLELTGLMDAVAGTIQTLSVTARDAFGNVATGYTGTIAFTSSDPLATLPDAYTFTAADAGTHAFADVILRTAESVTVTATDQATATITGSQTVTITPAVAATLVVNGLTDGATAGTAQTLTVTARDASGNVATAYTGTIAFTSSDPQATVPAEYTFTAEDAGVRSFAEVVLRTAGSVTVTATDQAMAMITGGQTVTVVAAAAAELLLTGLPDPATAGVANDLTVTARDAFGNTATGYAGTVQFSSSDPDAVLPAAYAFRPADGGVRTFTGGVTFKTAGEQTLQATDGTLSAGVSVMVDPAAAALLRFTTQPSGALAGEIIAPPVVVTAYDAFDNVATGFAGQVTIAIGTNPGSGALSGTLAPAAVLGVATFANLSIDAAGVGYTLLATASGLTQATSDPFDITAQAPAEVRWINPAGGLWSAGSNWSTGTPPTAAQNASIDLDGTYTVTLDVNATVNSLTLGAASGVQTLSAGSTRILAVATSGTILSTGRMALTNATVNGPGIFTNAAGGILTLSGTSSINTALVNAGTLVVLNSSTLNGSFTTVPGSLVRVQSVGFGGAALTVASGGFINHGAIELTGTTANGVSVNVNGTLVNAPDGTIASLVGAVGGGRVLSAQLENQGTVTVAQPLTLNRASADHFNSGTIALNANLTIPNQGGTSPSFTNTGTITVAPGRTWSISNASFTQAAGATLNGGGAMSLNAVNPAVFNTAFTLSALSLQGTTATFTTDITTETLALSLSNSTVNGPITLTNAATKTLTLSGTCIINTPLVNAGTLLVVNSSTLNSSFTTIPGSLVRVQSVGFGGAALTVASGFTNLGTIEITSLTINGSSLTVNGTLVNAAGGTITVPAGGGGSRTLTAQLDNQGTVNVGTALLLNRASADYTNSGLISLTGGNLTVNLSGARSFTNTGTVTVPAGRTLIIGGFAPNGGGFRHASGATLDGGGALSLSGIRPAAFEAAFTLSAISLQSSTVSFATDITTETLALTLSSSTIDGPGTLTNAADRTLTLNSSTINAPLVNAGTLVGIGSSALNGSVTTMAGSLMRVLSVGFGGSTLTVGNDFTNTATIELTGTTNNGATLNVNGTLLNAAGATIASLVGAGGARNLNAQLDNQGTLSVGLALTINRGSVDHANSGTIAVTGGDLTITQSGTSPSFTNSGLIDVGAARVLRISVGAVTNGAGASIQGSGTFETGGFAGSMPFNNAGGVTVARARIGTGLTSTGTFAPVTVEFFGGGGAIPVGAGYSYTNVNLFRAASFAGSVSMSGNLTVGTSGTSGNLTIGAHEITVEGTFATQNTGVLTMQNAAGVLAVTGDATFGGGNTNTRLTAGTLRVGGNFAQTGAFSTAAFAASVGHVTVLNGTGAQSVSFANPGASTTTSHFQRLEIANPSAGGVVLNSAVFANGQLRTPSGADVARVMSSAGLTLSAGGLDAFGLVLDGTPLRVVNGDALTRFDNATFRNMDPASTQLRLDRLADVVTFNNTTFETVPTSGVYLHLVDTDLGGTLFTVTMQGTTPANHGGKVIESVAGQLLGWPF